MLCLINLPNGRLDERERTFLLTQTFDLKLEPLRVAISTVTTAARLSGMLTLTPRLTAIGSLT